MSSNTPDIRHGHPRVTRNEQHRFDKYQWPSGLALFIYDDGRVKLEQLDATVAVSSVANYAKTSRERGSAHVIARFLPLEDGSEARG